MWVFNIQKQRNDKKNIKYTKETYRLCIYMAIEKKRLTPRPCGHFSGQHHTR